MAGLSAPSYGSASSAIACPASVSNSYHMSTIFAKPKCSDFVNKDGALHGRTTAECLESNVANDFGLGIDLDMKPHHIATSRSSHQTFTHRLICLIERANIPRARVVVKNLLVILPGLRPGQLAGKRTGDRNCSRPQRRCEGARRNSAGCLGEHFGVCEFWRGCWTGINENRGLDVKFDGQYQVE